MTDEYLNKVCKAADALFEVLAENEKEVQDSWVLSILLRWLKIFKTGEYTLKSVEKV